LQERLAKTTGTDLLRECVEYPLEEWTDSPGSKLHLRHFPGIFFELVQICLHRRRWG